VHLKIWSFEGVLAAVIALLATYYVLEPAAFVSSYAGVLGWSAVVGILILMIQGVWKTTGRLESSAGRRGSEVSSFDRAVNRWGGVHVALSIVTTIFVAIHSAFFLQSLDYPSVAIWFGAVAFVVLILVNLSGLLTEFRRKSRRFGQFRKVHIVLMLVVLALTFVHVEGVVSGRFVRSFLAGTIVGFLGALVVIIIVPLTDRTS